MRERPYSQSNSNSNSNDLRIGMTSRFEFIGFGSLVVVRRCGLSRGKEPGGITGNPWVVAQSGTLLAACKRRGGLVPCLVVANSLFPIHSLSSILSIVYARFLTRVIPQDRVEIRGIFPLVER